MDKVRYSVADNPTVFGKIIRKEIPAKIVYEDDRALAFWDIAPKAAVHVLIIPKEHIASLREVGAGDGNIIHHLITVANIVAAELGVTEGGYRLISNAGAGAGQEVPHLHFHLLAAPLGDKLPGF